MKGTCDYKITTGQKMPPPPRSKSKVKSCLELFKIRGGGGQTHFVWKFCVAPKGSCEQKLSWIPWPSNIPWGKVWVSEDLFKTRGGGDQRLFEQYKETEILVQVSCPTQPYSRECVDWLFPSTEQRQLADIFDSSSTNLFKYEILFRHKIQTKFLALKVISSTFILIELCNGLQD